VPGLPPGYIPGQPPVGYNRCRLRATPRPRSGERKLEEALTKSREQFDAVMQRLNEKEREAQEARLQGQSAKRPTPRPSRNCTASSPS